MTISTQGLQSAEPSILPPYVRHAKSLPECNIIAPIVTASIGQQEREFGVTQNSWRCNEPNHAKGAALNACLPLISFIIDVASKSCSSFLVLVHALLRGWKPSKQSANSSVLTVMQLST